MKVQKQKGKDKFKRKKKEDIVEEIKFDETLRMDYLTGFHKRNVEKKKQAVLKAKERQKQERLELRKESRKARLSELNQKFNMAEQGIEKSDEEPTSKKEDENIEFNGEQVKTTVTLISDLNHEEEEYSPAILMQRLREKARNAEEQQNPEEEEDSDEQTGKKIKNRKTKIKYETKANRKKEHKKNKLRNTKSHRK